jgi:hypothetical protein
MNVCVIIRKDHRHNASQPKYESLTVQFLWDLPYKVDDKPSYRTLRAGDEGPYPWGPRVRTHPKVPPDHDVSDKIRSYLAGV